MDSILDLDTVEWVNERLANMEPEQMRPERLLTGRDLIEMGYTPGPLFSEIIEAVEDAQLEGRLRTAEQARQFVSNQWPIEPE